MSDWLSTEEKAQMRVRFWEWYHVDCDCHVEAASWPGMRSSETKVEYMLRHDFLALLDEVDRLTAQVDDAYALIPSLEAALTGRTSDEP